MDGKGRWADNISMERFWRTHKQECYKEWNEQSYPITKQIHAEELLLPISPTMSLGDTQKVVEIVNSWK